MNRLALNNPPVQLGANTTWKPIADSGSLDIDPHQTIMVMDETAANLLGFDRQRTIGYNVWDILCASLPAYHHQAVNAAINNREKGVIRTRLSKVDIPVFLTVVPRGNGYITITISKIS
ncbi:PAS domain-containing protein [Olivibacter sp. XZL3]|uniref:PAS domain-containing protein n=1 Tax=Olivibacter sp. XZL3 TaxID=1735116 RepID=UPI00106556D8|nr:PAS domain-containing protein [Olivibacter sp. XZL3]